MSRCVRGLLQLIFISMTLVGCRDPNIIEKNLRAQVQQQLRFGSDKEHVIAFLRSRNIGEFSYSEKSRILYAIMRDVAKPSFDFIRTDIQLKFFFDEEGKLVSYTIDQIHTGF